MCPPLVLGQRKVAREKVVNGGTAKYSHSQLRRPQSKHQVDLVFSLVVCLPGILR